MRLGVSVFFGPPLQAPSGHHHGHHHAPRYRAPPRASSRAPGARLYGGHDAHHLSPPCRPSIHCRGTDRRLCGPSMGHDIGHRRGPCVAHLAADQGTEGLTYPRFSMGYKFFRFILTFPLVELFRLRLVWFHRTAAAQRLASRDAKERSRWNANVCRPCCPDQGLGSREK
jgi:hypothetical protein